ncbi:MULTISPECIES: ABC transporter permease [Paenibacillus]|uniref:Glutathione ABC transporter permease n=1 Tax=Paenibacillus naphthalenovorans TaxID=162209 RepID=A0A0U2MUH4_9BACL|nr:MULTISPECIES: ABC transporter permease [Paenibacillus]ALS21103.1 glutathione ABC transporter permease [Paenibacillus naphthalenovorans]NTZ18671.1 ABC transporter permease [Paenibacillus sp. JMULE4]SDJ86575.1 peptide/nickel transport system permease protein [Paenibacillus naphthalenovorans]
MLRYLVLRTFMTIPILFGVSIVVFILIQLIPGDPVRTMLGTEATQEAVEQLRKDMGFDQPLYVQYVHWLLKVLQGDFGKSIALHVPVADLLLPKLGNTIILTIGSMLVCTLIGGMTGIIAGLKKDSWFDRISSGWALIGASMPVFWLALMLMWFFSIYLGILPVSGMYNLRNPGGIPDLLLHLILPSVATATVSTAVIARITRSVIIEIQQKEYVRFFQSFGLSSFTNTTRHVLRNAFSPILNITGLQIGYIMGGALFSEVVFAWPGLGQRIYIAITAKDYPVIQAGILMIAVAFVLVNLMIDIINMAINPKLRDSI